jgi:hypothetical protein
MLQGPGWTHAGASDYWPLGGAASARQAWLYNSRVQYTSTADILVIENTVSLYASKYYTT